MKQGIDYKLKKYSFAKKYAVYKMYTHTHTHSINAFLILDLLKLLAIFLCYLPLHDLTGVFMAFGLPFMFQHS